MTHKNHVLDIEFKEPYLEFKANMVSDADIRRVCTGDLVLLTNR
jgi:hypothetical protein